MCLTLLLTNFICYIPFCGERIWDTEDPLIVLKHNINAIASMFLD